MSNKLHLDPHILMFVSLILLMLVYPVFVDAQGHVPRLLLNGFFFLILITGVWIAGATRPKYFWAAIAMAGLSFLAITVAYFKPVFPYLPIAHLVMLIFLLMISLGMLVYVMRTGVITMHKIVAAGSVYLLFGLVWANAYFLLDTVKPNSFIYDSGSSQSPLNDFSTYVYYSFVTLTNLGFGDITPRTVTARIWTTLEAVCAQLYLTILVARLVGLHIAHRD